MVVFSTMVYATDEKLKSYLDSNQLGRERLCRAVLALDRRFSQVQPRHPRGGRDGGRDIEAVYEGRDVAFGAIAFRNQASDTRQDRAAMGKKFRKDLNAAIAEQMPQVFVFMSNVNFTVKHRASLVKVAREKGIQHCEIFDRERMRILLDSPDGFAARFQYLQIHLTEPEQASFFAKWGADIQSVITTGFDRLEIKLDRLHFLQESDRPLDGITAHVQLDRSYSSQELGHFRLFVDLWLKQPTAGVKAIRFGNTDRPYRYFPGAEDRDWPAGVRDEAAHGLSGGIGSVQWEAQNADSSKGSGALRFEVTAHRASIGRDAVEKLVLQYNHGEQRRTRLRLRDIDHASYVLVTNERLADKLRAIHIYANGYKLDELVGFYVGSPQKGRSLPEGFTSEELDDPWVLAGPANGDSSFKISFARRTPKRLFPASEIPDAFKITRTG